MDYDDFIARSIDCCGSTDELAGFVFIVEVGLDFIRCLLISRDFVSDDKFSKFGEMSPHGVRWGRRVFLAMPGPFNV